MIFSCYMYFFCILRYENSHFGCHLRPVSIYASLHSAKFICSGTRSRLTGTASQGSQGLGFRHALLLIIVYTVLTLILVATGFSDFNCCTSPQCFFYLHIIIDNNMCILLLYYFLLLLLINNNNNNNISSTIPGTTANNK
jgi:hypothetical protein